MAGSDDFSFFKFSATLDSESFKSFFVWCAQNSVSDIHIQGGNELVVSRHGRLLKASQFILADDLMSKLSDEIFTPEVRATVKGGRPVDRALQLDGDINNRFGLTRGERLRFRCNFVQSTAGRQDTTMALTMRVIPTEIPLLEAMDIEPDLFDVLLPHKGLGLIGGETGSGKSTLLASIYRYCLDYYPDRKVTTTEDPIEYILSKLGDVLPVTQLQLRRDVESYAESIRAHLRRAPSIIGIGEMRDQETIEAAILAGQSGHLCLSTVHIHSPGEAISRCVTRFPAEIREAIARDMLGVLQFIAVQKLLRTVGGKRIAVREFIVFSDELRDELDDIPYQNWGRYIDGIIKMESRRISDHAWRLYNEGIIDRSELSVAMNNRQIHEFERMNQNV
ncbi:plasmid transfer ATPase TraJ [Morganella psychrotolerans]|uniref:plasmid transfer ATPase TraJ n=1 Tax=Morganella psychrotolerans TaxID=368603 RepID=UPI0039B0246D